MLSPPSLNCNSFWNNKPCSPGAQGYLSPGSRSPIVKRFGIGRAMPTIELEGGTWSNGRHTRPAGFTEDCEKYNWAALNGWRVFRITSDMLKNAPIKHLTPIIEFINGKTDSH